MAPRRRTKQARREACARVPPCKTPAAIVPILPLWDRPCSPRATPKTRAKTSHLCFSLTRCLRSCVNRRPVLVGFLSQTPLPIQLGSRDRYLLRQCLRWSRPRRPPPPVRLRHLRLMPRRQRTSTMPSSFTRRKH